MGVVPKDIRHGIINFLRMTPKPTIRSSRKIHAYSNKVSRASGGAPEKLVSLYKAHASRHR